MIFITAHSYSSSFKFPVYSGSPSKNPTLAVNKKAASFQYTNVTKQNIDPSAVSDTFGIIYNNIVSHGSFKIKLVDSAASLSELDGEVDSSSSVLS